MATDTYIPIYNKVTESLGFTLEDIVGKAAIPVVRKPITKRARHRIARLQNVVLSQVEMDR